MGKEFIRTPDGKFLVIDEETGDTKTVDKLTKAENNVYLLRESEKNISLLRALYTSGVIGNLKGSVDIKDGRFMIDLSYELKEKKENEGKANSKNK